MENTEYIRKRDAIDMCGGYIELAYAMAGIEPADVVQVETLQAKISELKYQMNCRTPNIDYYTGYMSALSTVEGILAAMREE